jgi:hypothetical protein
MQKNNKVSKVVNVYQEKYANDEFCTGLGDFIRGSLCLLQYANLRDLDCGIHYANHPIADFLHHRQIEEKEEKEEDIIHPFRVCCYKSNHLDNNTLRKINNDFTGVIHKNPQCIQLRSTTFAIYTIAFPMQPISNRHKERVRNALWPTPEFQETHLDATMNRLKIQPKEYNVIHVRIGDEYLLHGAYTSTQLTIDCKRAFLQVFSNHELTKKKKNENREEENDKKEDEENDKKEDEEEEPTKYVIVSDNVTLKQNLKRAFPRLLAECKPISHLGENACGKKEEVANTLVDFFLIANAKKVFGFSSMQHGTGFSQQCCQIYNVPYECHSI